MSNEMGKRKLASSSWMAVAVLSLTVFLIVLVSCSKPQKPAAATEAAQKTFATPDDAGKALADAVKANDRNTLLAIFGPASADLIFSGDAAQDKLTFENFTTAYSTMNRWRKQTNGSEVLYLGADNNPFPIPIKKNNASQWYFDTPAGRDEILARRIGDNELAAIDVVATMAQAQNEYMGQVHEGVKQYAQKFVSDEGKQNGLYWKSAEGRPDSPLGRWLRTPPSPRDSLPLPASNSRFMPTSIASSPGRERTPRAEHRITWSMAR